MINSGIKLIVGLGNPGAKYAHTPHNAGFWVVDALARQYSFPPFQGKFAGLISKGRIAGVEAVLLKPQTFMNLSGSSVQAAVAFYKLPLDAVWVVHDELDLPPHTVKIKQGGGDAGHKGLKDITQRLGAGYHRVRMGIGHPRESEDDTLRQMDVADYVLRPLPTASQAAYAQTCGEVAAAFPNHLQNALQP